ncbi:hypothetical protein BCR37DRAFT_395877 [Protomyces lactucae-debilis]|uniref:Uncharacterized protein n=1 Tax=Protomyces lactucae-debilis TaxID=2754530 RepID=A0A1Y2ESR5_PROLT|nr:uncharacterized protein BCR37DRAFT_395877 [Protomyces lactucae-debilis]ORY73885.1 hypothetical protein BCR37DRAFT_395877 [Protomyces lactucae-debilis]
MTSFYPQLAHEIWQASRAQTSVQVLRSEADPSYTSSSRNTTRICALEARKQDKDTAIARFGDRWIRPFGCSKTLAQQEEEAGEVSASYEQYQDEDGEAMEGEEEEILTEMDEHEHDLDGSVEHGASFDMESSYEEDEPPQEQHQQQQAAQEEGILSAEEASDHSYDSA